ncbi:MAG: phage tail protein [Chloroflexales bacterium]|nr:phage tail protein [Chloroflexales bacterium]
MSDPERGPYPFTSFNFAVEINVAGVSPKVCNAAFAECDGLEMTMEVKTIREGGNNGQQIRLSGPASYGQLSLKRGMTGSFDLWNWFSQVLYDPALRADAHVVVLSADSARQRARFLLRRCVPVKLKAPALNAKDGVIAIEELALAYESLVMEAPQ